MLKQEFEEMTIKNGGKISAMLYNEIERFYTSENDYHATHGGTNESKQEFARRVFGGKVNTPARIARKIAAEAIAENRYALRGCDIPAAELVRMDKLIRAHIATAAKMNF